MVLLKNEDGLLPLTAEARRIALIGPYARHGRVQGGGSARVRPEHGRGPLEALQARQLDVTFEPGGSIAKYLPTVRGDFTAEFSDSSGASATVQTSRLAWYWDHPPAEGIDRTKFAARVVGIVRARLHGRVGARRARRRPGDASHSTARPWWSLPRHSTEAPSSAWAVPRSATPSNWRTGNRTS